jgi:hypothetical protein
MGTLKGTISHAPPINLFESCLQIIFSRCEELGDQNHHGLDYRALGSFPSNALKVEGFTVGTLE